MCVCEWCGDSEFSTSVFLFYIQQDMANKALLIRTLDREEILWDQKYKNIVCSGSVDMEFSVASDSMK